MMQIFKDGQWVEGSPVNGQRCRTPIGENGYHEHIYYAPVDEVIRAIASRAFRARFTFEEKVAIESSSDAGVKVLEKDLAALVEVNLDSKQLKDGLDYYVSKGLLLPPRVDELLSNGVFSETQ